MLGQLKERLSPLFRFPKATSAIAAICIFVFVIQTLALRIEFPPQCLLSQVFAYSFGFYWPLLVSGAFWQPVTYAFLHGSFWHLALNLFTLLFFGSAVEKILGSRRYTFLFLISSVIGGFAWAFFDMFEPVLWGYIQLKGCQLATMASQMDGGWWQVFIQHAGSTCLHLAQRWGESQIAGVTYNVCVGASAGVFGLVGAFAGLFPRERLVVLLFYVIPLKLQARYMALLLMVISLVSMIADNGHVAHVAHLFGGLGGYAYACVLRRRLNRD